MQDTKGKEGTTVHRSECYTGTDFSNVPIVKKHLASIIFGKMPGNK